MKRSPFEGIPAEWRAMAEGFMTMRYRYQSALREVPKWAIRTVVGS